MHRSISLVLLGSVIVLLTAGPNAHSDAWTSEGAVQYGPWSTPVNLGPIVNSSFGDAGPEISADGLSLYFHSMRTGATNADIFVSRRLAIDLPWETPVNLGSVINSSFPDAGPVLSHDGRALLFGSNRGGNFDIYASHRRDTYDDFAWEAPVALPAPINGSSFDVPATLVERRGHHGVQLYFLSDRSNGLGVPGLDIYVTEWEGRSWSDPVPVMELNSPFQEDTPNFRSDGLEVIFASARDGNLDLYVARRNHTWEPWSVPEPIGEALNTQSTENQAALSANGRTLYFLSNRPGGSGATDLYVSTRARLRSLR